MRRNSWIVLIVVKCTWGGLVSCGSPQVYEPVPGAATLSEQTSIGDASGTTYPRVNVLQSGALLATVTRFTSTAPTHHLQVLRSDDAGASWHALGEIEEGTGDIDNAYTLELPQPTMDGPAPLLAAYRNHTLNAAGQYTTFRISMARSDDAGATWQKLGDVEEDGPPWGVWEPLLRLGKDGAVQIYYAKEYAADNQDIVMRRSTDQGRSWSPLQTVAGANITSRDGMPGVAPMQSNSTKLTCIFETTENGLFHIEAVSSDDDGATWNTRRTVYMPPAGRNAGAPQVAQTGDTLLASFMTDEDVPTPNWPNQAAVKILVAQDPMANTWGNKQTAGGLVSQWAGLTGGPSGQFWVAYDHDGARIRAGSMR